MPFGSRRASPVCFIAAAPSPVSSRTSAFTPRLSPARVARLTLSRRAARPAFSPPRHATPSCHTGCGSHSTGCGSHSNDHANDEAPTALSKLRATVAQVRDSVPLAVAATIALVLAAILHIARVSPVLARVPLYLSAGLGVLPALAATVLRLVATRGSTVDVDTLMSLAAAICLGTGAVFEGALLAVLYAVSHAAETAVQARARRALDALRDAAPATAWRLPKPSLSAHAEQVPVEDVRVGEFVLVRAGELLPCDGIVAHGSAFATTQILTGESTPRAVTEGDELPAGARAEDAPLAVRVTRVGAESSLARIARLVTAAQENRPSVAVFFDRFGQLYARGVLVLSAVIATMMPLLVGLFGGVVRYTGRSGSLARGLGFLVAASPCALLVGGPVAYVAALNCCARMGVLAKSGAKSLEAASRARHVVFDKTGTLTTGMLKLDSAALLPDISYSGVRTTVPEAAKSGNGVPAGEEVLAGEQVLVPNITQVKVDAGQPTLGGLPVLEKGDLSRVVAAAAALERGAVHPIATAVQERAIQLGGKLPDVSDPKVIPGQGVEGVLSFDGEHGDLEIATGRLGSPSYVLGKLGVSAFQSVTEEASFRGETVSVLEIGTEKYLLRLRDELRQESADVVTKLKDQGLAVSVLTGDGEGAAQFVSNAVGGGIKVISNATPEQKLNYITKIGKELGQQNSGVLMVGDGVNDAAALAASLVGVACGLSSATAVHAADVVLVREDLNNVAWFMRKAAATKRVVQQNIFVAFGLMLIGTGACVGGAVPLWLAVTLHEGGTLLVGLNALRLLRE